MNRTFALMLTTVAGLAMFAGCNGDDVSAGGDEMDDVMYYTVRSEDKTLENVSETVYGDPGYADEIAGANPDVNRDNLSAGQELKIPEVTDESGRPRKRFECDRQRIY